jgi:hypothetical protein
MNVASKGRSAAKKGNLSGNLSFTSILLSPLHLNPTASSVQLKIGISIKEEKEKEEFAFQV